MTEHECKNVFALLSEHLDGELAPATCDELEKHIQDCEPCVEFVESLKKSIALGRTYKPSGEPTKLSPEVKRSLQEAYERMLRDRAAKQQ
jgi:anti-sigma factor RsiW